MNIFSKLTLLIMGLVMISALSMNAEAQNLKHLEFLGACSWAPKAFWDPEICIHQPRGALAIFVRDTQSGKIFVSNEIASVEINYCQELELPAYTEFLPVSATSSTLQWHDRDADKDSSINFRSTELNTVQASTNSVNQKDTMNGGRGLIYAPCFFTKSTN